MEGVAEMTEFGGMYISLQEPEQPEQPEQLEQLVGASLQLLERIQESRNGVLNAEKARWQVKVKAMPERIGRWPRIWSNSSVGNERTCKVGRRGFSKGNLRKFRPTVRIFEQNNLSGRRFRTATI